MDLIETNFDNAFRHPWELSRAQSLLKIVRNQNNTTYADIGAGDLFFSSILRDSLGALVSAVDVHFIENSDKEALKKDGITLFHNLNDLPDESMDCAILMDVLEHVEDDALFLNQTIAKIKHQRNILITVPAFQFLFSEHDRALKHFRRYNKKQLLALAKQSNLEIKECFYFYFTLWIVRVFSKYLTPKSPKLLTSTNVENWKFRTRSPITITVKTILNMDFYICRMLSRIGIALPGLSLCLIGKKQPT
jgi:2-polyprenyl-3-methyl-5-hydroxy-6-metoxy-1,4-benzoquinol methylase